MHECNNGSPLLAAALVFSPLASQYVLNTCQERGAEGQMDDLIGRLGVVTGVDRTAADRAVGIIPQSARSWAQSPALASSSEL